MDPSPNNASRHGDFLTPGSAAAAGSSGTPQSSPSWSICFQPGSGSSSLRSGNLLRPSRWGMISRGPLRHLSEPTYAIHSSCFHTFTSYGFSPSSSMHTYPFPCHPEALVKSNRGEMAFTSRSCGKAVNPFLHGFPPAPPPRPL